MSTVSPRVRDDQAFGAIVSAHQAEALRLAWLLVGDRARAEEVVADAFAGLWVRWQKGDVRDVSAYLRASVVNGSRSVWRRRSVRRRHALQLTGDGRGGRAFEDQAADRQLLAHGLAKLTVRQRQVVVLRYYQDLSVADTAQLLGISEGTVRSTASRALAALAPWLAGEIESSKEVGHGRT